MTVLRVVYGDEVDSVRLLEVAKSILLNFEENGDGTVTFKEFFEVTKEVKNAQLKEVFEEFGKCPPPPP